MAAFRRLLAFILFLGLLSPLRAADPIDPEADFDESLLKENRIASDVRGVQDFLRRRTLDDAMRLRVESLIKQLGHDRYPMRDRAVKELVVIGVPALTLLENAATHTDQEIAERAKRSIDQIRAQNGSTLSFAILRVVERKKFHEGVLPIIDFLPFADDRYVEAEAFRVLGKIGMINGTPAADLVPLVKAPRTVRRAAAGYLLGRSQEVEHRQLAFSLLKDADPWVRLRAAQGLLAGRDKRAIPALIALLDQAPEDVAWQVEESIRRVAGEHAPAPAKDGSAEMRREYRKNWEQWWKSREPSTDLAKLDAEPSLRGITLGIEYNTNTVWECGLDGKRRWTIQNVEGPMDAQLLPGERVLIAEQTAHRVSERTLDGKIVWEKLLDEEPLNARRLRNGNTFIGTRHKVMEVRPNGSEVFKYELTAEYLHAVRRLSHGGFLGLTNAGKIVEMDSTGKNTKTIELQNEGSWGDVESLPGGHYLVTNYSSGFLREVDSKGAKLKEVLFPDACGLQILPNGRILLCGTGRVTVVDWSGKTQWESKSEGCVRRASRR